MMKVAIVMGSDSDLPLMKKAFKVLEDFQIPYDAHIYSAHRTPVQAIEFASTAASSGYGVIIAGAGKAAHLAGILAANTILPVIGVPISASLGGFDALLSTVQMPTGIPVATVAVDGAGNAALLAAQILALGDKELSAKLSKNRIAMEQSVLKKNDELEQSFTK
ncbi:phosphoribosylaminoimidazole carboxylase, PurE protein [Sphaerochaeta pleomorpha str. Grapes]|uniref:N5-carboxyaminoimidazole ribonucleotide mutase n=1 Tax=Sphaerochaeta pleomorpha (strain ATCC BAA-1885 / DSM 22778 / Grapes) TaxID=158190 RepID=G8QVA2_SPHPG|nr:5-(carboxyamino)imidazole ribonucleotide mutase [Sphaerochaeta pleomorpha]AEV30417.1 phosphoribosylaminoimidazole carboxylase, PurE protein [Sphaerochaeta pleomorpha str. Grapes]